MKNKYFVIAMFFLFVFFSNLNIAKALSPGQIEVVNMGSVLTRLSPFNVDVNFNPSSPTDSTRSLISIKIIDLNNNNRWVLFQQFAIGESSQTSYTFKEVVLDKSLSAPGNYRLESWVVYDTYKKDANGKDIYKKGVVFTKLITLSTTLPTEESSPVLSYGTPIVNHDFGTAANKTIKNSADLDTYYYWGLNWGTDQYNPKASDEEWQNYTAYTSNNYVFGADNLSLVIRNIDTDGTIEHDDLTSGCLRSKSRHIPTATKSLYFESRMKLPKGKGLWSAFWLYPGERPRKKAEIDIFEIVHNDKEVNSSYEPLVCHTNLHAEANPPHKRFPSVHYYDTPLNRVYHIWGCEWTATELNFYFDNKLFRTMKTSVDDAISGWGNANPANYIINLAAGGSWTGDANDAATYPTSLDIDYIRVFSKDPNNTSGTGTTNTINSVTAPTSVAQGQTVSFDVNYEATADKTISCTFQQNVSPWSSYVSTSKQVTAGTGTINITMNIPSSVPLGSNYQFQTVIGDGTWAGRDDNLAKSPITVTNTSSAVDEITSVSAPINVTPGESITVAVSYNATTSRQISTVFQLFSSPWTSYASASTMVSAGSGTVNLNITLPTDIPPGIYHYQSFITTTTGNWGDRFDNLSKNPVTLTASSNAGYKYLKFSATNAASYKIIELDWLAGTTSYPTANLTSNTSQTGVVVSGNYGTNNYKAFDGIVSDANGLWVGTNTPKQVTIQFTNGIVPTQIRIQKMSWEKLYGFKCEGSNDGATWDLLLDKSLSTTTDLTWIDRTYDLATTKSAESALANFKVNSNLTKMTIFPNPGNGLFHISFDSEYVGYVSIEIYTIDGRVVNHATALKQNIVFEYEVNAENLPEGIYLIRLIAGDYQSQQKLIKN